MVKKSTGSYDAMMELAAQAPALCDGLFYLPFLVGERTPHNSENLKAAFMGINISHYAPHFVRAVVEGVSYSLRDSMDVVRIVSGEVNEFVVTGGFVNSQLWLQILSNVLNVDLLVPEYSEGAALGAAFLAGLAQGVWDSLDQIIEKTKFIKVVSPTLESAMYQKQFQLYKNHVFAILHDVKTSD